MDSKVTQTTIAVKDGGKSYVNELSKIGEINLMYYMEDEPWPGARDYSKYVTTEYDVLTLIWLSKIETK